jgi:hypothetical protein
MSPRWGYWVLVYGRFYKHNAPTALQTGNRATRVGRSARPRPCPQADSPAATLNKYRFGETSLPRVLRHGIVNVSWNGLVKEDDFQYAIENTQVILAPERQIATFGSTSFNFYLISELMDRVDQVRIRNGKIHAERPQILTPDHFSRLLLEGFGEKAQRYVEQLRDHLRNIAVLRYGFQFRKTDVTEETIRDSVDAVISRTKRRVENSQEPLSAVIQGVDDAWEVCLLKFTIDMIERSSGGNLGDFRKRGLI